MSISRARTRVGRRVRYRPTAANVTAHGAGDYVGQIVKTSKTSADLDVTCPDGAHIVVTGAVVGARPGQYDFFGGVTP